MHPYDALTVCGYYCTHCGACSPEPRDEECTFKKHCVFALRFSEDTEQRKAGSPATTFNAQER
jgi:hypothetical protein